MDPLILAITPGDPDGVGPEIVAKGLARGSGFLPLLFGAKEPFEKAGMKVHLIPEELLTVGNRSKLRALLAEVSGSSSSLSRTRGLPFVAAPTTAATGLLLAGYQSGWAVEKATHFVQSEDASALVTGPIDKKRLNEGGYNYPGHTEFLAELCGVKAVTMMLANHKLRVTLVTLHAPLSRVPSLVTAAEIRRTIEHTAEFLRRDCGIMMPEIAVMGLNPHAGEKGILGNEEGALIEPLIKELRQTYASMGVGLRLTGPHPADTFFALHAMGEKKADAVVCMYHDQGLIPVKLIDFKNTVNLTLGLPIIRTSVDHGVAFDIAGQDRADPSSFIAATELAMSLVNNRMKGNPVC